MFPVTLTAAQTSRRGKVLVGPVDLTLGSAGITVVVGPNGAGKSSLLALMHGTARLTGGDIRWAIPQEEARKAQAFVFQRPVMLRRSVAQNLAYPLRMRGVPKAEISTKVQTWAARVGLGDLTNQPASALSGGEQQKLALARALVLQPQLVFLDEPCSALDGRATREVETVLAEARDQGTRLILSTHDMGQARRLADDVVFLNKGRVAEHTPAAQFFDTPQTPEAQAFLRGDIVE